jgi:hypothetical protein
MAPRKKHIGVGAVVSTLTRFLKPTKTIKEVFPDGIEKNHRLTGLVVVRQEEKYMSQR